MPVNTLNAQYKKYAPEWEQCRAAIEGERAVKDKGTLFLPQIAGQDNNRYSAYKKRALFFNATGRTVEGLLGFLFRKPPILTPPNGDKNFFNSLAASGSPFDVFLKAIAQEVLSVGRVGVLCDVSVLGFPQSTYYAAESIINWRTDFVVLREQIELPGDDEFEPEKVIQYRVLDLVGKDAPVYRQRLFRKVKGTQTNLSNDGFTQVFEIFPVQNGIRLNYIPFVFINQSHTLPDVEKPPLIDIVNVNFSHYRSSADLEQGRHYTALPTPVVAGFDPKTKLQIGSGVAWVTNETDAKAWFLEFTGQGLGALENALKEKEAMMAVLGARLLEAQKSGVEAADTYRIRNAGEASVLASIASTIDSGMTWICKKCAEWRGLDSSGINVEMNKDYMVTEVDAALLAALFASLQGAAISAETWFYNLQKWEMIPDGHTFEDEMDLIAARTPGLNDEV